MEGGASGQFLFLSVFTLVVVSVCFNYESK